MPQSMTIDPYGIWVTQSPRPVFFEDEDPGHVDDEKLGDETNRDSVLTFSGTRSLLRGSSNGSGQNVQKDEEQQPPSPPTPVGFWNPRLKYVRREAFFKWSITTSVLMSFIILVLSLFWGAFAAVEQNLSALVVFVVDFDGRVAPYNDLGIPPVVGPTFKEMAIERLHHPSHLGYEIRHPSDFDNDPMQVRQAVYNWDAWAAVIINPNATALLHSSLHTGNTSYDPNGAVQLVYQVARDDTLWETHIMPEVLAYVIEATAAAGQEWGRSVMDNITAGSDLLRNARRVPQAINPAVGFTEFNLRPFYPFTTTPAVSIGLIYLIIISFFSFAFYLPIHFKYLKPEGHPPLKFWQLVLWRWCSTMLAYLCLSLAYSLVPLAFGVNMTHTNPVTSTVEPTLIEHGNPVAYGRGTFPVYWMLNFVGMIALGLACENVAMVVGQPWSALWLIFWVISNVCTSFYDLGIEPGFYLWGHAWPLAQVVEGSRSILFDLKSHLGLNFGILFAWAAVNTAIFPWACYFMRWKSQHHIHEYYR